ncbi:glutathione S-transferase family protein [Dongia deserti]|uniref:glutathione S-transferase family protein n=1 Tax=Dongia deserti TaxID=2268030 RepID=UPI000E64865D|nr:glutathione S-transferase family protein [Dongia deserti]
MNHITLFGASYSVYVRIVRLVLEELGIRYDLAEIDIFSKNGVPPEYLKRHPFGRIPAFEHDGFHLFETDAIVFYIVERFGGEALLPADVAERARMRQIMRIIDNYGYRALVWGIYVEETERDRAGRLEQDELERASMCLGVLEDLTGPLFLVGAHLSLADLWVLPMLSYLKLAPSGAAMLRNQPKLSGWLDRMHDRPSVHATRFLAERAAS